jgi:hypothetical protein
MIGVGQLAGSVRSFAEMVGIIEHAGAISGSGLRYFFFKRSG